MPADVLAPQVSSVSAGMVLTVYDRQHVELPHCEFGLLLLNNIQDMIQNVNTSFIIFKLIQHVNIYNCSTVNKAILKNMG